MIEFKSVIKSMKHHGKILWKGFKRMVYGAATAGLIGLAVYGFAMIPGEGGYTAVCEFVLATATMAVAMMSMYQQGCCNKKGAKK